MNKGRTLFSQLMDYFPERAFQDIVGRYGGDKWVRSFSWGSPHQISIVLSPRLMITLWCYAFYIFFILATDRTA